jgi:hypothetical protein
MPSMRPLVPTGGVHLRYVYTREGSTPATIPGDVARGIALTCTDADAREHALDFAGLVMFRLGSDAGAHLLRHWNTHEPALLRDVDPVLVQVLANTPELITGPLRA